MLDTNVNGTYYFCKAVDEADIRCSSSGRVGSVNISSIAATHVNKGQANYAASKGAINSASPPLPRRQGCRPKNVTVNAVAPGFIRETEMTQDVPGTRPVKTT